MYDLDSPLMRTLIIGAILTLPLKIVGIWRSARNDQKGWYAAMVLLNTVGILELIYLFYFAEPKPKHKD